MGVHDIVRLDTPRQCLYCGHSIEEVQLDQEGSLEYYETGDCIGHAEEYGVRREQLYCPSCYEPGAYVYLSVFHGILIGICDDLVDAKQMLHDSNLEVIFLYHSLYKKYRSHRRTETGLKNFMEELVQYFEDPTHQTAGMFFLNAKHLKGASSPMEAIRRFLAKLKEEQEHERKE